MSDAPNPKDLEALRDIALLGRLVGGVAHDMKNVLQIVIGHAELVRRRVGDDPKLAANVDHILAAAERGAAGAELLLARSRVMQRREPVALLALIRETLARWTPPISSEISVQLSEPAPAQPIQGDPPALRQLAEELIRNAILAMPKGGTLEVEVTEVPPSKEGLKVQLRVTDTGMGIPPQVLARLQDPHRGPRRPEPGSGIGLAVVHRIVQEHGGLLEFSSTPGAGTSVRCLF